jgi:hypothetical protein
MNGFILCTVVTMNILSAPGGRVVGTVPAYKQVVVEDVSLLRDLVFVSKPGPDGVSLRGWVAYGGLRACPDGGLHHG